MNRLRILFLAVYGELLKLYYRMGLGRVPYGLNKEEKRKERVVVSLTSYGRRVSKVVPYAVISLLRQTCKPDVIVLWLDSDQWNDDNLPPRLACLRKKGLTIRYCPDRIKSYTKLIPSLKAYPDDIIITVDDDTFYRSDIIEMLVLSHKEDTQAIHALKGHKVVFSSNGRFVSYNEWEKDVYGTTGNNLFLLGYGAVLYKKSLLYDDIFRDDIYMKLCPNADDIWFFFMETLQGTAKRVLSYKGNYYIPIDFFYQNFHSDSALYNKNGKKNENDDQMRAVEKYYRNQIRWNDN